MNLNQQTHTLTKVKSAFVPLAMKCSHKNHANRERAHHNRSRNKQIIRKKKQQQLHQLQWFHNQQKEEIAIIIIRTNLKTYPGWDKRDDDYNSLMLVDDRVLKTQRERGRAKKKRVTLANWQFYDGKIHVLKTSIKWKQRRYTKQTSVSHFFSLFFSPYFLLQEYCAENDTNNKNWKRNYKRGTTTEKKMRKKIMCVCITTACTV